MNRCFFGQAVQDRNEGGKPVAKSGGAQSQGGKWEEESGHRGRRGRIQKTVKQCDGVLR